jgi:hypothetical protein
MELEVFVRASGVAMGLARDSFGVSMGAGGGSVVTSRSSPMLTAAVSGSGQAASAAGSASNVVGGQVSALGEQDLVSGSDLGGALAAAGAGRGQMDSVISGALADITSLAASTLTPAGQQALVSALAARLEQTWQALTNGNADSSTRAASSTQVAAAYSGLGNYPVGGLASTVPMSYAGAASSMAAMSPVQSASTLSSQTMAANQAMIASATEMASMQQASTVQQKSTSSSTSNNDVIHATLTSDVTKTGATGATGAKLAPLSLNTVLNNMNNNTNNKLTKVPVCTSQAGFIYYANQALTRMGITDSVARNLWLYGSRSGGSFPSTNINPSGVGGLLLGAVRESSWRSLAINLSDSNAVGSSSLAADHYPSGCSRGLMQTVPGTFGAYHQYNTSYNIYDPVANITAAMNYLHSRYHVEWNGSNLADVPQFNPYDHPQGY